MLRRLPLPAVALALAIAAGVGAPGAPGQAKPKPNILVVMTDDQTVESLRVMQSVQSLLAREGTTFDSSFASFPLCCPSRATFVTGQYGHNHTVMGNQPPAGGYEKLAPTHGNTLPAWLRRAGYHTIHIGKYLNGYGRIRPTEVPAGWAEWYGSIDPSTYQFYNYTLNENGRLVRYGADAASYQADVYTRKAVDAIRRRAPAAQPFFLSVAYLAPHSGGPRESDDPRNQATPVPAPRHRNLFASTPLPMPGSFNEADVSDKPVSIRNRRPIPAARIAGITENYRQRLESLLAVDEGVAQMVTALRDARELDDTLIVFTADNGFMHGEHRIPAGKTVVYEPSIRVPLILRGPGVARNVHRREPVANIDLAPTILDAANARPGRVQDGVSLLPLAADGLLRLGRDVLLETGGYSAIRTPRFVYAEHSTGEHELYDLQRDPDQLTSQHGNPALVRLRTDLAARLARLRACAGGTCKRGPAVLARVSYRRGRDAGGRCARGPVGLRVAGSDAPRIASVRFFVGTRAVANDARAPFARVVPRRFLPRTRSARVRAYVMLRDSRIVSRGVLVRACR